MIVAFSAVAGDIILEHADKIVTDMSGEQMRTRLYGTIRIIHDGRHIYAGYADWDKASGKLKFLHDVRLVDSIQVITTDTLHYFRDSKLAIGIGDVFYRRMDSTVIITGDNGRYDGINELLEITGAPHFVNIDSIDGTLTKLDAVRLIYDVRFKKGTAIGSVHVKIIPADTLDPTVFIDCDSLVFYPSRNEIYAFGRVEIRQKETVVFCGRASFYRVAGRMNIEDDPVVIDGRNRLVGSEMIVELEDGEIERIRVLGSEAKGERPMGFWRPPEDSLEKNPESRFTSKEMVFDFEDGEIELAHLVREAHVDYFPWPEDSLRRESNSTYGDSIAIWFGDDEFDSIEVHTGAEGFYIVQNLNDDSLHTVASEESLLYSGDFLAISRRNETVAVQGMADLSRGDMSLEAGNVLYDIDRKLLTAEPILEGDSLVGMPVLVEKDQVMTGKKITYNIDTGRGRMIAASSSLDLGYFHGGVVHKARGETLYVANSDFIPCECETALTHLSSDRLKLIPNDKAVARYIILYIGKLPVFAIPFFVFPVQSGRQSGILTFNIGQFQKGDRFIRNVGYYWAPSDYWDLKAGFDYDEGKGILLRGKMQYKVRYRLNGSISTTYELQRKTEFLETTGADRWSISGSHLQYLWPNGSITANASFVSDKEYLSDVELDPQERMQRNLSSSAAFSQSFDWGSISASVDRNENLESGLITSSVPKIRVNRYTRPIFPAENEYNSKFYNKLSLSINGYAVHYREKDSIDAENHTGFQSNPALSLPFSLGPYLSLNPRINGRFVAIDRGVDSTSWPMRFTYDTGIDAGTNIYGRIPLGGFIGMGALKHDISPKIGLTWTPEFESAENFYSFAGIGAGGGSEALRMTYTLTQDIGIKTAEDTTSTTRDIRLGSVSTSGSYDFLAEERAFSDLRTGIRTNPFRWLSITAGFTHSLYSEDGEKPSTLRLLSREITSSASWRGSYSFGDSTDSSDRDFKASLSHYISESRSGGYSSINHWIKGDLDFYLTKFWRVQYSHYYDLENSRKVSDEIKLWRDMGCWEGTLIWVPSGFRKGWYFRINIKKMPDIKVEGTRGNVR